MKQVSFLFILALTILSCGKRSAASSDLPDYGEVYIPHAFTNQDGNTLDSNTVKDKIYVADFFFTSCNTICPKMSAQLLRVQEKYKGNEELELISFSIDPKRDTIERLKWYANKLGADTDQWHFATAPKEIIDETSAIMKVFQEEDASLADGFNHQGRFLLVDKNGKIRGSYNGTQPEEVDELIGDIDILLQ